MARPTIREQEIIKVRNEAIIKLVRELGYAQAEVARLFNMNRVIINQIVNKKHEGNK